MTNGHMSPAQNAATPLLYLREEELDRGVALVLAAARALMAAAEPALERAGLGAADFRALGVLARGRPVTVLGLAGALGVAKQSITRTLEGLEARGLVARTPGEQDRRTRLLTLTPAGEAAFAQAAEAMRACMGAASKAAGPQTVAAARDFLAILEKTRR
jgi:DNA-binding MarR family transcriptional regulator